MTIPGALLQQTLGCLLLLLLAIAIKLIGFSDGALDVMHTGLRLIFVCLSLLTVYLLVRKDSNMIWMPCTLFVLASAIFYGFGPLAHAFGNDATKTYLALRRVSTDSEGLIDSAILSFLGITLVMTSMWAVLRYRSQKWSGQLQRFRVPAISPLTFSMVLLIGGLVFKYAIFYPSRWGILSIQIPGFLSQMNALAAVGFGLLTFLAFSKHRNLIPWLFVFWLIDFCLTSLNFAKSDLVLTMLLPLAGYFQASRKSIPTGLGILAIVAVYTLSQPMVAYARTSGAEGMAAGYSERAEVLVEYWRERPEVQTNVNTLGSQRWWTRLDYSPKQALAMELYDRGEKSASLEQLPIIFIPRALWPDKPIIRGPGQDFYFLVTGRDTNRMSMSVYADLYWQFGWFGVLLIAPIIGVGYAAATIILLPEVRARNFIYFPAVLIGIRFAALDPNKYFINGVLTTSAFLAIYLAAIYVFEKSLRRSAPPPRVRLNRSRG